MEESDREGTPLLFEHRAGCQHLQAWFWTRLKVGERNDEPRCFHSSKFLERTEQDLGNKVFNRPGPVTTWFFGVFCMKINFYIFCDVCEIYKPNLNDFKHKLCNFHKPFVSCAYTRVMFQFVSFRFWILCTPIGFESGLVQSACVQLVRSATSLIEGTLITCLCELSSSQAASYWGA